MTAAHRSMQVAALLRHVDDARQVRQREWTPCPKRAGASARLRPTTPIRVATERWTTTDGRIDITVDIPSAAGRFCLAFENKPYAHDQGGQLKAYLEYLGKKYGTRFLLVYLPPVHREPDEASLPQVDRERWHGHFRRYDDVPPNNDGRTRIMLHSGGPGPNRWYWGVQSPNHKSKMTGAERERHEELRTALGHHGLSLAHGDGDWWPQWEWLPRYKDWDPLVPDLHDECEAGGGPITDCYVDGLLEIAALAIPAINEVETAGRATPSE